MDLQERIRKMQGFGDSLDIKAKESSTSRSGQINKIKREMRQELIDNLSDVIYRKNISDNELSLRVRGEVQRILNQKAYPLTGEEKSSIIDDIINDVTGYGPIEEFLDNKEVTEIMVNNPQKIYIEKAGKIYLTNKTFLDEAHLFAGKKQTETCEVVKLFAQEGRKFGANIVIGTQRPQLLDTTIRAQAGTWVVHNLSDIRDIGITISSAEDLSNENKSDISGLDKGQGIICDDAIKGTPLFVKIRNRRTKH